MSRIQEYDGWGEDYPNQWQLQEANTQRQLRGKKGRAILRQLEEALLALPEKKLVSSKLAQSTGEVCAVGAMMVAKRVKAGMTHQEAVLDLLATYPGCDADDPIDSGWETWTLAAREEVAPRSLAWEFVAMNDERCEFYTPEQRYEHVLSWVQDLLKETP